MIVMMKIYNTIKPRRGEINAAPLGLGFYSIYIIIL
jgi:hypothetical protein